jgi:DNA polymerase-3 subunit delta'
LSHPREVFAFEGGEAVEQTFLGALARGRLHHAWLLTGSEGIGKATFAYRAARRLLGARAAPEFGPLGADPDDPVTRQVAARAHPDLLVLERWTDDGKPRRNIPVDEARQLPEFFAKSPASAPYRVAIIDAADDLNANAANAVLKTLEEPPPRGVLFLVSHAPGRLLPTIRSRCRRLTFPNWTIERTAAFVAERAGVPAEDAERLALMSRGAPGRAMVLAQAGALEADRSAQEILRALPQVDEARLLTLADSFRGGEGQARFNLVLDRLADRVREMSLQSAAAGETGGLDRWSEVWSRLVSLPGEVEGINLDRADAFFSAIGDLRQAARL